MTPDTDPGQTPDPFRPVSGVTPGKGVRLPDTDTVLRLPRGVVPTPRMVAAAAPRPEADDLTAVARAVGMVDRRPRIRRRPGKWDRALLAVAKMLGVAR